MSSGQTKGPVIQVENLHTAYKMFGARVHALRGVSIEVNDGEFVGIVGESGSGKSTLGRALLGLLPERTAAITGGRIVIGGKDVTRNRSDDWESIRGNPIAMVFQDPLS